MPPLRLYRSAVFRLTLVSFGLFTVALLVLVGAIYWFATDSLTRQIDATIDAEIRGLAEQFDQRGLIGLLRAVQRRSEPDQQFGGLYLLTDANYAPLAGNLSRWPDVRPDADGWITFPLEGTAANTLNYGRARTFELGAWYHLLVGHDLRERTLVADLIRDSLLWGLAATVALSLIGGMLMSRRLVARIDAINRTSREIMAGDLARRVPVGPDGDEFDQLAQNLNAMLDQIERLMAGLRQVSDNIAHDLRTPLARLRSRLEVTLMEPAESAADRAAMEATIAEADGLLKTFNALLSIAQAEAGAVRRHFAPLELKALLADVAELYEPLAEERGQAFEAEFDGPLTVQGDRDLLFQAVANLLDNAIKFAPRQGSVALALRAEGGRAVILVSDSGPGIPAAECDRVTERFYRLESSRSTPGSGLGLSLVAAVATLHGGRLVLEDNAPGLRARIEIPLGEAIPL